MSIMSRAVRTMFDGYEVTATTNYVYNADGGTAATAGWFSARADNVLVSLRAATMTATSLSYRIEGRNNDYTKAGEIYSETLTAVQTIDKIINVTEKVKEIRLGAKKDNDDDSATTVLYAGLIRTEMI